MPAGVSGALAHSIPQPQSAKAGSREELLSGRSRYLGCDPMSSQSRVVVLEDQGSWCVPLSLCSRSAPVPLGPGSRVSKAAAGRGMFSRAALLVPLVMEAQVVEAVSFPILCLSLGIRGVCPRGFSQLVARVFLGVGVHSQGPGLARQWG